VKELFKKLGFLNNKDKKTDVKAHTKPEVKAHTKPEVKAHTKPEVKTHTKPEVKAKENGEKLKGFDFHHVAKENTIKGCSFVEDKV
jgi:hypothetical protein